jgi:hypothetical protein
VLPLKVVVPLTVSPDPLTVNDPVITADPENGKPDPPLPPLRANEAVVANEDDTAREAEVANEAEVAVDAEPVILPLMETLYAPVVPPPEVRASYN